MRRRGISQGILSKVQSSISQLPSKLLTSMSNTYGPAGSSAWGSSVSTLPQHGSNVHRLRWDTHWAAGSDSFGPELRAAALARMAAGDCEAKRAAPPIARAIVDRK